MRTFVFAIGAALCSLMLAGSANANDLSWPQTQQQRQGHYRTVPSHLERHGNHSQYVPSQYEYHRGRDLYPNFPAFTPGFGTYQNYGNVAPNTGYYQSGAGNYPGTSYPARPGCGY